MRILTLICLFFLISAASFAQTNYTVRGTIADSVEHIKLANSSIAVLQAKDSVLLKYTRANDEGAFSLAGLSKGKFILLVSYPQYADYTLSFSLDSIKQQHNFGNINISPKSRLLKEVIVKGTA